MTEQAEQQQFGIQRIFVRDISFESPQGAAIFGKQWKPSIQQELATSTTAVGENQYEVVLTITLTAKQEEQTAFLVEVQQAGVFLLKGFTEDQLRHITAVNCATVLFPYARQVIDMLLMQGTLPPLLLPPVNFDALYQQAMAQRGEAVTAH